jgi:hypothetical protein
MIPTSSKTKHEEESCREKEQVPAPNCANPVTWNGVEDGHGEDKNNAPGAFTNAYNDAQKKANKEMAKSSDSPRQAHLSPEVRTQALDLLNSRGRRALDDIERLLGAEGKYWTLWQIAEQLGLKVHQLRYRLSRLEPPTDRDKARLLIKNQVRRGLRPHPNSFPCADCGHQYKDDEKRHVYDHHLGYAPEHYGHVEPVCDYCHGKRGGKRRRLRLTYF